MTFGRITRPVLAAMLVGLATVPQSSARIIYGSTNPFNFSFTTKTALVPLARSDANVPLTTVTFVNVTPGIYELSYSAECSVDAVDGDYGSYVDIDILVNNVAVKPTVGNQDAFCAADGKDGFSGWVRASITMVVPLVAGQNRIQIRARRNGGAGGWISDGALVIND